MALSQLSYADARAAMRAGDVIAFGGKGQFSEAIKLVTRAAVSHVGVIVRTHPGSASAAPCMNQIIEATTTAGVAVHRASERIASYEGDVWWLPLRRSLHVEGFNARRFAEFLFAEARAGKGYDFSQAIGAGVDLLDRLGASHGPTRNIEDFESYFCSELVAAGLEAGEVVPALNASEVTPIDLCRFAIYEEDYFQLSGEPREIPGFGTLDPAAWA